MTQRRGGLIQLRINGEIMDAMGNWTYNLGRPKREMLIGADRVHGHTEKAQAAFIEGEITDRLNLDVSAMLTATDAEITMDLGNGKSVIWRNAVQIGDGDIGTENGNISVKFAAEIAEEVA